MAMFRDYISYRFTTLFQQLYIAHSDHSLNFKMLQDGIMATDNDFGQGGGGRKLLILNGRGTQI